MISDSIPNASFAIPASKDFIPKKKRVNRSAKLKQCKLDARREQWLSQVKTKVGSKEEVNHGGQVAVHLKNERVRPMEKLEIKPRTEEEIYGDGSATHHFSDSESSRSNSPTSHTTSVLGSNDSGTNFTGSSGSSSRSSVSSRNDCCSGNLSDEEEDDEGGVGVDDDEDCLDDWEAMADALEATDNNKQKECNEPNSEFCSSSSKKHEMDAAVVNANPKSGGTAKQGAPLSCCAWRPDDSHRPQSLPNLAKQYSFPLKSERHFGLGGSVWGSKNFGPAPTSCPICFEDLDHTDTTFSPCVCGFTVCLFCHKRISEEDGRCPGCRKQYEYNPMQREAIVEGGSLKIRLARSCSMVARS